MFDWLRRWRGDQGSGDTAAPPPTPPSRAWAEGGPAGDNDDFVPLSAAAAADPAAGASPVGRAYRCVALVSELLASAPMTLAAPENAQPGERTRIAPIEALLARPSRDLDPFTFWSALFADLVGRGNAFARVAARSAGYPTRLVLARGGLVVGGGALSGMLRQNVRPSRLTYSLTDLQHGLERAGSGTYPQRDVVALHGPLFSGWASPSPIATAARQAIQLAGTAVERQIRDFDEGLIGRLIFKSTEHLSQLTPEQQAQIAAKFRATYAQSRAAHKVPVVPPAFEPELLGGLSAVDVRILELMRWSAEDVAAVFGVPPQLLGLVARTEAATDMEALFTVFVRTTLRPHAQRIEQALTLRLVPPALRARGYRVELEVGGLQAGTPESEARLIAELVSKDALLTPNEGRARLARVLHQPLAPLPGGDILREAKGSAPPEGESDDA